MNSTFQNSAQVFSIGIFFTLMISGLAAALPSALTTGLEAHHVPADAAAAVATSPPVSVLFAAFLGYNPIEHLLGPAVIAQVSPADTAVLTGNAFFPNLISGPFEAGLHIAFGFAIAVCLIAAAASLSRGTRYVAVESGDQHPSGGAGTQSLIRPPEDAWAVTAVAQKQELPPGQPPDHGLASSEANL
jgi:hypothetical protein